MMQWGWKDWAVKTGPWAIAFTAHALALPILLFGTTGPKEESAEKVTIIALESLVFEEDEPEPVVSEPTPEPEPETVEEPLSQAQAIKAETSQNAPSQAQAQALPDLSITAPSPDIITSKGAIPPPPVYAPPNTRTQRTLQALSCNRLGKRDLRPECQTGGKDDRPGQLAITAPDGWQNTEIGPNPFETALDKLARKQYADRSTPYSLRQANTSDHQHANPFAGTQSSAERDLTGRVNASPDPVWGD